MRMIVFEKRVDAPQDSTICSEPSPTQSTNTPLLVGVFLSRLLIYLRKTT